VLEIVVLGGGTFAIAAGAVIGGVASAILVYALAYRGGVQGYRLVLIGLGIAAMLVAVTDYLLTRSTLEQAQAANVWLTGSLNGRGWEHVRPVAAALAILLPATALLARQLRMLELGDDVARALGVSIERSRLALILVAVLLAAVATASASPVVFVALAAPQIARRLTRASGPGVACAALMGAALLLGSDFASERAFGPTQLPVGVVTGVGGGLYLIWLLRREWRGASA
jgi:iron complex transport system permease protein